MRRMLRDRRKHVTEDRPAIILHNLRRVLRDADRRGETIRPRRLLDIIEGKKA